MDDPPPQPINNKGKPHLVYHQIRVLVLTFLSYATFHASRKPPSIAKSLLSESWAPFDVPVRGARFLAHLDLAFLASYSLSMLLLSGPLADRLPISPLLLSASLLSGLSSLLLALAFFFNIHSLPFFLIVQTLAGVFQSFGWPCVVAIVGNWFAGSEKKGFIMGVWNSHTSVGNIAGSVLASAVLEFGWGWSFVVPGILIIAVGILVYGLLVVSPRDAGFDEEVVDMVEMEEREDAGLLGEKEMEMGVGVGVGTEERAIGFVEAWRLPGVAPFAFCLFFSKLVAYTFLYWLPFYIQQTSKFSEFVSLLLLCGI